MKQFRKGAWPLGFRGSVQCASLGWLTAALFLTGCGGKKEETTKTRLAPRPLPAIPNSTVDLAAPAPGVALPPGSALPTAATPAPAAPAAAASESDDFEHTFQRMNMLLGEYVAEHKRIPKDVNEMVAWKIISKVPPPPAGKRYVIDQSNGRISLK